MWAHPRSRGENLAANGVEGYDQGSSPLTRGKLGGHINQFGPRRLIPAHAGKTRHSDAPTAPMPAHPRSRGENSAPATAIRRPSGSSPLTRGKRQRNVQTVDVHRLIPAHAGKTDST